MPDERGKSQIINNTRFMAKMTGRDGALAPCTQRWLMAWTKPSVVLDTLDAEGLADNTIVLFFSDNGGAVYAIGGADNPPLRGGKGDTFGKASSCSDHAWPERSPQEAGWIPSYR